MTLFLRLRAACAMLFLGRISLPYLRAAYGERYVENLKGLAP